MPEIPPDQITTGRVTADSEPLTTTTVGPNIPPKAAEGIFEQHSMLSMMGGLVDPMSAKITEDHITDMIGNSEKCSKREHTLAIMRMVGLVIVLVVVLGFVMLFCWMNSSSPVLVDKVMIAVVSFAGGIGAGLGAPKILGKPKED